MLLLRSSFGAGRFLEGKRNKKPDESAPLFITIPHSHADSTPTRNWKLLETLIQSGRDFPKRKKKAKKTKDAVQHVQGEKNQDVLIVP